LTAARKSKRPVAETASQSASPDLGRLLELISAFPKQTIALAGDLVLDQFVSGEISRVSREAPVLILRHRETRALLGGGANALNNLADLGAKVLPVGAVADDASGEALVEILRAKKIDVSGIEVVPGWTTPTKTRFLAGWTHTSEQQVLRLDNEPREPVPERTRKSIASKLKQRAREANAILISDYGFGSASPEIAKQARGPIPSILDSRYALLDFRRAGITAATPNEAEIESLYGAKIGRDATRLEQFGRRALADMRLKSLLVTRGKDGMALFEPDEPTRIIPIHGPDEAADVTGAGDTVIAVFTLAVAASATFLEAAHLANFAGGIVVMKRGTATVTRAELNAAIRSSATSIR
jgi:rfaE bifunctional protein kinase chain/domain